MTEQDWVGFSLGLVMKIRRIDERITSAPKHLQEGYTKLIGLIESLLLLRPQDLKATQAQDGDGWRLAWVEATPTAWQASAMYDALTLLLILELCKEDYL